MRIKINIATSVLGHPPVSNTLTRLDQVGGESSGLFALAIPSRVSPRKNPAVLASLEMLDDWWNEKYTCDLRHYSNAPGSLYEEILKIHSFIKTERETSRRWESVSLCALLFHVNHVYAFNIGEGTIVWLNETNGWLNNELAYSSSYGPCVCGGNVNLKEQLCLGNTHINGHNRFILGPELFLSAVNPWLQDYVGTDPQSACMGLVYRLADEYDGTLLNSEFIVVDINE